MSEKKDNLEMTEKLFAFLQGKDMDGCTIPRKERPRLTADQAWTVIWWLGNQYWQVTDHIERCEVCGEIYETWSDGDTLDYGGKPYSFCGNCVDGEEYAKKLKRRPKSEAV
jgi:hypothetical protein